MPTRYPCGDCGIEFHINLERCPHCARPGLFPNVRFAEEERAELHRRYEESRRAAAARGAGEALEAFEQWVGAESKAVLARSANELQRLATSDNEVYATFYELLGAHVRLWETDRWSVLRSAADAAFFPGYHTHIRFAALSLDSDGLSNYGDCSITLRTEMIAHRASVFEENTVMFLERRGILFKDLANLPAGFRATWDDRALLCAAKLAAHAGDGATPDTYASLLLRQGQDSEGDEFMEVHIWGPMTARTFERVALSPGATRESRDIITRINRRKLESFGVEIV
jgi:hypothetical protein